MKKIYILTLATLALASCNKMLDELPDSRSRLDTPEKIKQALTNAYPRYSPAVIEEFSSDNTDDNGADNTFSSRFTREIVYWQPISGTSNTREIWDYHYRAIAQANEALEAINELGGNTAELRAAKGEALLTRAYAHFVLANLFCKAYNPNTSSADLGIPYMLAPEKNLDVKYSRGTVAQVYEHIDRDLQEGLPLIDDSYYQMPKYHFNKRASYAFAARFYLYYQQWEKALNAANEVLTTDEGTTRNLVRNWSDFRNPSVTGLKSVAAYARTYTLENVDANLLLLPVNTSMSSYYHLGNNRFSHGRRLATEETVGTFSLWDPNRLAANNGYDYYWYAPIANRSDLSDVVLFPKFPSVSSRTILVPFTTDETLLVRAEAKILLGQYDSAVNDLNIWTSKFIRIRETNGTAENKNTFTRQEIVDFYNALSYSESTPSGATQKKHLNASFTINADQEPLLHYVLQCRRILTVHEGLRWQDVRRYGIEVPRYRHRQNDRNASTIPNILTPDDLRRCSQLPSTTIGAGMEPNPR